MSRTTDQHEQTSGEYQVAEQERREREQTETREREENERRQREKAEREENERIQAEFRQKEEADRKEREECAKAFDEMVKAAHEQKKREWTRPKLGLVPVRVQAQPNVQHLKHLPRSIHNVDPEIVKCMRGCCCGQSPWPLFLHGQSGCGKTYAALALADCCADSGYYTVPQLCQKADDEGFWSGIPDQGLVILDDIGAHDKCSEDRFYCVQRFLDQREGKPTICLSNLIPDNLIRYYDDRISSRLRAGTEIEFQGPDRRF